MSKALAPKLYKYLDVNGALLTLRNRNFKHSRPSEFNDQKDLTVESLFPGADEEALASMWANLTDVIAKNIDRPPTCYDEHLRYQVSQLQAAFKLHPESVELIKAEANKLALSEIYDLELMKQRAITHIKEINDFMQQFGILCVSEVSDSMRMWARYAEDHQGIVLKILPNLQKDSKFTRFRAVRYQENRPPVYDDPISYLEGALFADQNEKANLLMDRIIYAKTSEWAYEREQRLAIPVHNDRDWNVMPYHPEEVSALYLGAKINKKVKQEIISLATGLNPEIAIFQAIKGSSLISFFLIRKGGQ